MTQMNFLKKAALFSGVAMFCLAAPAEAGFEWRGPIEPPAAAPAPETAGEDMQGMAPVTAAEMTPEPVPQQAEAPVTPAPVQSAPVVASVPPADMGSAAQGDVISGFGSDLPLVIALQQVVPPGYQYSFSGNVNPGVSVSWEGGKPWQQVLSAMLAPQGLGYRISGNAVIIGYFAPQETQAAPAAYAQAPDMSAPPASAATSEDLAPVMIAQPGRAEQLPAELGAAPEEQPVSTANVSASTAPVTIRRQKPSSLLERLGWARSSDGEQTENIAVPRQEPAEETAMSPAPAGAEMPAAQEPVSAEGAQMAAVAAPAVVPAPEKAAPAASGAWDGAKGATLRDVLKSWSDKAGVELYWSIDYDYRLSRDVDYTGSYDEAVGSLLDQFASVRPQPYGQLHQSANGPRVLVVKSYDLTR